MKKRWHGPYGPRGTGWIRLFTLCLSLAMVSLSQAQTWSSTPADGNWSNATNWTGGVPNGSSATATFASSAVSTVTNDSTVTLSGAQYSSTAPSYTLDNTVSLWLQGTGVMDLSGKTQQWINTGALIFGNGATTVATSAGDVSLTNTSAVTFTGSSTAAQASISNQGLLEFDTNANAGSSTLQNNGGLALFLNNASAQQAFLTNSGSVSFEDMASAGSATLINNTSGNMDFSVTATGGNAVVTNNGNLTFDQSANAGNAHIQNDNTGSLYFNGSASASAASIVNQGTLAFGGNASAANAVISNAHILDFNGSSISGNAQITNTGILNFSDTSSAQSSSVVTGNGGKTVFTLGATGATAQFITGSGGVFDASGLTSGTLNLGSYTQASGATLQLAVGGGSQDLLVATGGVTLGGSLAMTFEGPLPSLGGNVTILTAVGGVEGGFSQWNNPSGSRLFPLYQSTAVYLESVLPTFQVAGLTPNEKAVARALDAAFEDSSRYNLVASLVNQSQTSLPAIYSQVDPSGLGSLYQLGFLAARSQAEVVAGRMGQDTPVQPLPPRVQGPQAVWFAADLPASQESAIEQDVLKDKTVNPWGGFLNGYGDFGTLAGDGNAAGYQLAAGGLIGGADYRLSPNWTAGILLGYVQGNADPANGGEVDVNGGQAGLYAGLHDHGFHMEILGEAGLNNYKFQQVSYGGTATGTASGEQFSGSLGLGYRFRLDELKLGPFVSAQYCYVHLDSFNESGSNAPLQFPGQGESAFSTEIGVRVDQSWKWSDVTLGPGLSLSWEHLYQGSQDSLTANLGSSSEAFSVQGPATGQDALVLGVTLEAAFQGGWELFGEYQGRIGRTNDTEENLQAGLKAGI